MFPTRVLFRVRFLTTWVLQSTLSADVLRMASRFPRRLFLTISSSSHRAMLRTRSRAKTIIEQCEQGRNVAALERIVKAPNNFGGQHSRLLSLRGMGRHSAGPPLRIRLLLQ